MASGIPGCTEIRTARQLTIAVWVSQAGQWIETDVDGKLLSAMGSIIVFSVGPVINRFGEIIGVASATLDPRIEYAVSGSLPLER